MEDTLMEIVEQLSMIVAGCSGLSALLPTTKDKAFWAKVGGWLKIAPKYIKPFAVAYEAVVTVVNVLGCNFGKAKNKVADQEKESK